jgi:hypothetical protein
MTRTVNGYNLDLERDTGTALWLASCYGMTGELCDTVDEACETCLARLAVDREEVETYLEARREATL